MTLEIKKHSTKLVIARPDIDEPYYRGTRFDRTGIVLGLEYNGHSYVSQWFLKYDPYMHDAVGGPSEEYTQIGYEDAEEGDVFLKIGVGLLKKNRSYSLKNCKPDSEKIKVDNKEEEYNRFKLYEIAVPAKIEVEYGPDYAIFTQTLEDERFGYCYIKKISIVGDGHIKIEHEFKNCSNQQMHFYSYNHNFFVLDGGYTGIDTVFKLPFKPMGDWRTDYDCVHLTENGIEFSRDLEQGESVFMGNLHDAKPVKNYSFRLYNKSNGLCVDAKSDATMEYAVFWSNHEVSCLEPYIKHEVKPNEKNSWTIDYQLSNINKV